MTLKTMHNQRLALCATAATALMLTACSSDEVFETEAVQNPDRAVSFDTYLPTRSTDLTLSGLRIQGFGVYAYHLTSSLTQATKEGVATLSEKQSPNFMNDQSVSYSKSTKLWSYSPLKYWPGNTESQISFMAWAPYAKKSVVTLNSEAGDPTLGYSIKNKANKLDTTYMFDLVAAQQYNLLAADQPKQVTFNFKHALSRLNINVKAGQVYYNSSDKSKTTKIKVNKVILTGSQCYTGGTLNLASGLWSARTAAGNDSLDLAPIMRSGVELGIDTEKHSLFNGDTSTASEMKYLYMVPNAAGQSTESDVTVTFHLEIVTEDSNLPDGKTTQKETRSITVRQPLVQSLAYNWNFTILLSGIKFDATVDEWEYAPDQPGTDNIIGEDNSGDDNNSEEDNANDDTTIDGSINNSNGGNIDQYINEGFYLCNDRTYTWTLPNSYKFEYAGNGLFTLKMEGVLEDFMISTGSYYMFGAERATKEYTYELSKQLKLGVSYPLITSGSTSNLHYVWLNDGLNMYTKPTEDTEEFKNVTLTFDPVKSTVTVTKNEEEGK